MTPDEQWHRYRQLSAQAMAGLRAQHLAALQLKEIRDEQLYLAEFKSFGEYVRDVFELTASEANKMIRNAERNQTAKKVFAKHLRGSRA